MDKDDENKEGQTAVINEEVVPDLTDNEEVVAIPEEVLKELPPEARRDVTKMILSMQQHSMIGSVPNPIVSKITSDHVSKILEISEKDDERAYKDTQSSRRYALAYVLIAVALFIFITLFLSTFDTDTFKLGMGILVIFMGGAGSGFGVKTYISRNN